MTIMEDKTVCLVKTKATYSDVPPFDPSEAYPELKYVKISRVDNPVYRAVRQAFIELSYDRENIGKPNWNPLSWLIKKKRCRNSEAKFCF